MASVRGLETVRVLRCRVINQSINHELVNANTKKQCDARGIRTPNLEVWNLTRYRCAMASCTHMRGLAQGAARRSWSAGEQLSNSNAKNNNGEKRKKKKMIPQAGLEPATPRLEV